MNRWKSALALAPLALLLAPATPASAAPTVVNAGTYNPITRFATWTCAVANAGPIVLTGCELADGGGNGFTYGGVVAPGSGSYAGTGAGSTIAVSHGDYYVCAEYVYGAWNTGRSCTRAVTV